MILFVTVDMWQFTSEAVKLFMHPTEEMVLRFPTIITPKSLQSDVYFKNQKAALIRGLFSLRAKIYEKNQNRQFAQIYHFLGQSASVFEKEVEKLSTIWDFEMLKN